MKVERLVSKWDWFKEQHGFCWLCGTAMTFKYERGNRFCATFDHLIPVRDGGTWDPENLLLAHQDCNARRGHNRHVFWLYPPHVARVFTFKPNPHRRTSPRNWREIRPERASVHRAWTRLWMIDKGLIKA